jgi:hypothetical protein
MKGMRELKSLFVMAGFLLVLLTSQSAYSQQPITPANLGKPGTTLVTTFENGTSQILWVNGTVLQFIDGIGVLILDPSVSSSAAAASASAYSISNINTINRIYQAIAVAIGITIPPPAPLPPQQPPTNDTQGPDERCLFDPTLPHCASVDGECPEGFANNAYDQCFPLHDRCPSGYHSHEDDESGRCIPDSTPCQPGYIMDPDFPTCTDKDSVCNRHPQIKECQVGEQPGIESIPEAEQQPEPTPEPTPEPEPDGDGGNGGGNGGDNNSGNDDDAENE